MAAQINRRTSVLFRRYRVFIRRSALISDPEPKIIPQLICDPELKTQFKAPFYHNSQQAGL